MSARVAATRFGKEQEIVAAAAVASDQLYGHMQQQNEQQWACQDALVGSLQYAEGPGHRIVVWLLVSYTSRGENENPRGKNFSKKLFHFDLFFYKNLMNWNPDFDWYFHQCNWKRKSNHTTINHQSMLCISVLDATKKRKIKHRGENFIWKNIFSYQNISQLYFFMEPSLSMIFATMEIRKGQKLRR